MRAREPTILISELRAEEIESAFDLRYVVGRLGGDEVARGTDARFRAMAALRR